MPIPGNALDLGGLLMNGMDPGLWAAIQSYSGGGSLQLPGAGGGMPTFSAQIPGGGPRSMFQPTPQPGLGGGARDPWGPGRVPYGGGMPTFSAQIPGMGGPKAMVPPGLQGGPPQGGVSTQPQGPPQMLPGQRGYQDPRRGQATAYRQSVPQGQGYMPGATVPGRQMQRPAYAMSSADRWRRLNAGQPGGGVTTQPQGTPVPIPPGTTPSGLPPGGGGGQRPKPPQPAPLPGPWNQQRPKPPPGSPPFYPPGNRADSVY